jgi:hypothetical protein
LISASNQRKISHAIQDNREHRVVELTLQSNSEFDIEVIYFPSVDLETSEMYFGCEAQDNEKIGHKPLITSFHNKFIERELYRSS